MRSNSGKDESRNNLHDPTLRDRGKRPSSATGAKAAATKMGFGSPKVGAARRRSLTPGAFILRRYFMR